MTKKPFKRIAISTLIATVLSTNIFAAHTFAAENPTPIPSSENVDDLAEQYAEFSLGPDGIREAIQKTGSNALGMDLYALTLLKQPNIDFRGVTLINDALKQTILNHQLLAKENAKTWLDELKPQLIQTNENIISYDIEFQNYYGALKEAADTAVRVGKEAQDLSTQERKQNEAQEAKDILSEGLLDLTQSIEINKQEVDDLVNDLKKFRDRLTTDTQNFKTHSNTITSILASEDAGIPLLKQQLDTHTELINKYNDMIIGGAVATALGPVAIVGGAAIIWTGAGTKGGVALISLGAGGTATGIALVVKGKEGLDESTAEIKRLTQEVTESETQVVLLSAIGSQLNYLSETIDEAITALENISNQWGTMASKYTNLAKAVQRVNPERLTFITNKLSTAKDQWADIKEYAEQLYLNDIQLVEKEL
ncbi:non-hemolytic enterotoxin subunit B [Virgibacillus proomii]|jgi:non-hemolytic enterotoxin B/C|uniref:non-hemolytic enterotoxin subunit B n=1 Tax=Virgibacillus proomii TaxID=84407 RepID=UPI00098780B3|nr:HBL/NHE enterotoxin family protein [Virgibacillus proomii]